MLGRAVTWGLSFFLVSFFSAFTCAKPSDSELASLGQQYADAINVRNAEAINALFDFEAIASKSAEMLSTNPSEQQRYRRGLQQGLTPMGERLVKEMIAQDGRAIFLRVQDLQGVRGPLVRYDMNDGYNYLLLKPTEALRIGDTYVATNGDWLSDTLSGVSQMMFSPSESLLGRLLNKSDVDKNLVEKIRQLGTFQREGKPGEAYRLIREFPPEIRNQKIMINLAIQMAINVSESAYRQELNRLAQYFKDDPSVAFMLIDHYYYQRDFDAAMKTIGNMEKTYGNDGAIAILKANVELERDNSESALMFAKESIALEPNNEEGYWTLLTITMLTEKYSEGIAVINQLETKFDYQFEAENFEGEEIYAGFIQSTEFRDWLSKQ